MQNKACLELNQQHEDQKASAFTVVERGESYYVVKRILDFTIALTFLILFSPIMLVIAALIIFSSPGPVFFKQERVGAKRRTGSTKPGWERVDFQCYKFRTMEVNADESLHQAYVKALIENNHEEMTALQGQETETRKLVNDPRVIRPGAFLRKFSLDELPQFWNVLRGDMSLVGPRPAIPYEVDMYKPWHMRRLDAQPGITGLQQVTARCTTDFDEQVRLDLEYIDKQSVWLDIFIMFKTPLAVISTKGAH